MKIKWLGHASFRLKDGKRIYIDPYNLSAEEKDADIILITHDHYDHCSIQDINQLRKPDTKVIAPAAAAAKIGHAHVIHANESLDVENVQISTVPAYNINKKFHPRGAGVGYIISDGGISVYHAGDTDHIPEMDAIKVQVAIVPIGGTYTMNASEAAQAINRIRPQIMAIPMHYGSIVGSKSDAEVFKQKCNVEVKILNVNQEIEV